jgi:hypothetical protein
MPHPLLVRLTLLIGVAALALAIIPAIVYDEPAPWEKEKREERRQRRGDGELKIKVKGIELTWGRRPATQPVAAAPAVEAPPPPPPADPIKPYRLSAVILALTGLIVAPLSWRNRGGRPLAVTGVVLCCAAVFWHYIAVGVAAGVAVGILLLILGSFG